MADPREHPRCRGWVVGLSHECVASALREIDWRTGEFLVRYEKSPEDSPAVVCLYNNGASHWCTKTTATYACPHCPGTSHTFEIGDPVGPEPSSWFGVREFECRDGRVRSFGLYLPW